jgi:hypothetical protein
MRIPYERATVLPDPQSGMTDARYSVEIRARNLMLHNIPLEVPGHEADDDESVHLCLDRRAGRGGLRMQADG